MPRFSSLTKGNALSLSSQPDELTLRADASEVARASEWLEAICSEHGVPREHVDRLLLCLDDALANVLAHGGPTALSHPIGLLFEVALLALVVHPQSRDYQRIWFR